jgi:diadenosine tetraphosphate (Ap4A) HIT family hydrolase
MNEVDCPLCAGRDMDEALMRTEVWSDDLWRLTTIRIGEVAGFSYLEPKRHIPDITMLNGTEAASFGSVIADASSAIKQATGADLVYVYIFGDAVPHLHVHLAPHRDEASPLVSDMIKGNRHKVHLPSGEEVWASDRYPLQPQELMHAAIDDIRASLNPGATSRPEGLE